MINLLKSHTSVRKYTDEKIDDETLIEMLEAAQYASSSHFVQAYSVIRITDEEAKKKLQELSNNYIQIETAPVTLVFCADLHRLKKASELYDMPFEGSTAENLLVSVIDTALFAQNFVVAAESKGYGICYIGGIRNEIDGVDELLKLPDHVIPLFGLTVGVPVKRNEVKPRLPLTTVLHENVYDDSNFTDQLRTYDEIMRSYYQSRSANQKDTKWTNEMAHFFKKQRRERMKSFLEEKGFFLK